MMSDRAQFIQSVLCSKDAAAPLQTVTNLNRLVQCCSLAEAGPAYVSDCISVLDNFCRGITAELSSAGQPNFDRELGENILNILLPALNETASSEERLIVANYSMPLLAWLATHGLSTTQNVRLLELATALLDFATQDTTRQINLNFAEVEVATLGNKISLTIEFLIDRLNRRDTAPPLDQALAGLSDLFSLKIPWHNLVTTEYLIGLYKLTADYTRETFEQSDFAPFYLEDYEHPTSIVEQRIRAANSLHIAVSSILIAASRTDDSNKQQQMLDFWKQELRSADPASVTYHRILEALWILDRETCFTALTSVINSAAEDHSALTNLVALGVRIGLRSLEDLLIFQDSCRQLSHTPSVSESLTARLAEINDPAQLPIRLAPLGGIEYMEDLACRILQLLA